MTLGSTCTTGVAVGSLLHCRLPTVKQTGQAGCQAAWMAPHASQRQTGSEFGGGGVAQRVAGGLAPGRLGLGDIGQQHPDPALI